MLQCPNPDRTPWQAVGIPETVSRKALAAGKHTANNRRLAPNRSRELMCPDKLLGTHANEDWFHGTWRAVETDSH